jgi:hypothetical protein
MPTFRIDIQKTQIKQVVLRARDRAAAEEVARALLDGKPVDGALLTDTAHVTADSKERNCSVTEEPYGYYDSLAATIVRSLPS